MENKGCITCKKCEQVRINFYCGRTRLTQKQLYKHGYCSKYEPRESAKAKPMTNEEWFCQLSTEKKAEWLEEKMTWAAQEQGTFTAKGWEKWLKEIHHEN